MTVTAQPTHRAVELIPVTRERLADLETPVSAFAKLRALGGAFLLESAEGGERMGRYSFIGVLPRATLVFRDGTASTWSNHLEREYRLWRWRRSYRGTAYRLLDARQATRPPDAAGRAAPTTVTRKG